MKSLSKNVRVRFAPSPTGYLHVGGARTALFNWLFARRHEGSFILRVEDTDVARSSEEMVRAITEGLRWLGISWDEGPILQSSRIERHREVVGMLLERGEAYRCFCPKELIDEERKAAEGRGETYVYPGTCLKMDEAEVLRRVGEEEAFTVRFRVLPGKTTFQDEVYGELTVDNSTLGDFILLRSGGNPTYHLAVVVDDHDMRITHVIRGEDHRPNTPKQLLIYQALGWSLPVFAHLPLLLGSDKKRLRKRHGATAVGAYREEGILPEALFNFLALLGWSPGDDREIMSREEMIRAFSLDRIIKRHAIFDATKLEWMNSQYFSCSSADRLDELVTPLLRENGLYNPRFHGEENEWYRKALLMLRERAHRLSDFIEYGKSFFTEDYEYDPEAVAKRWRSKRTIEFLASAYEAFEKMEAFTSDKIEETIRVLAEELDVSAAKLIHPVRVAVSGKAVGPGLFDMLELLGRDRTIQRVERAISHLTSHPELTGDQASER